MQQYCTAEKSMQSCPKGSKQHCIRKNIVQFCLYTLGTTLYRSKPYAILSERFQATFYKKHIVENCFNTLGIILQM